MEEWQLQQLQGLPLEVKIRKTKERIKEWHEHWGGQVKESSELYKKYKSKLAKEMIVSIMEQLELEAREIE